MDGLDQTAREDYIAALAEVRAEKDAFFGTSPQSPVPAAERRAGFKGLRYYPPDPTYRVEAEVVPFERQETVPLGATQGDVREMLRFGEARFTLQGQSCRLTVFKSDPDEAEIFAPFRDATSGAETYGAGRYLDADLRDGPDGALGVTLDFNLAYSPWCAYNAAYSCTLPPAENRLPLRIEAGERTYHDDPGHDNHMD